MGFLARGVALEQKGAGFYERWMELLSIGSKSKAGPTVNRQTVFRVSAAFACMRAISQGLAQVPFALMQDYQQGGLARKRDAVDHQVYDLLKAKPNSWQTAFEFVETLGIHASLGNAYVFKNQYRGKVAELFLLNPGCVHAEQKPDWTPVYRVHGKDGTVVEVDPKLIWHIRGPSWDGFLGLDILQIAKEALGLSMSLEESHASLHANGVRPAGLYSVDGTLDKEQHTRLTDWLKANAGGANNAGAPLILDRAAKWVSLSMTGMDAQHLETRNHEIEEVCRFFGVLPTIIGYTGDKANTYASAEVMEAAHKVRTLGPWYKRVQDSANVNLLTDDERRAGYYTKFKTNALMAAAAKDRADYYAKALGAGGTPAWMTQDEVRALDDLDPMGGSAAILPPLVNKPSSPTP